MAGPSLIPGSAGVTNAGGFNPGQQGGDSSDGMLKIVQLLQQIQGQKQGQAQDKVKLALDMAERYGIPPDEKTFTKNLKEAGIPIEELTNAVSGQQMQQAGGSFQGNQQGAQSAFDLSSNSAQKNPGGGVTPKSMIGMIADRAAQRNAGLARSEEHKRQLDETVMGLKDRVLSAASRGEHDPEAIAGLMAAGGIPFNMDQATWEQATPDERQDLVKVATHSETSDEKERRLSSASISLFGSGRYSTLEDSRKAAEGKQVNTLPDLNRMGAEAAQFHEFLSAGLSTDQAKDAATQVANGVSLSDALPKGVSSVVQEELGLNRRQVQVQEAGLESESKLKSRELDLKSRELDIMDKYRTGEIQNEANKMLISLQEKGDKDFNSRFDNYVNMKRAKVSIDSTLEQNMINELAVRSGMLPEKVKGIWDYLTFGGGHFEFKPDTSKDQSMLDKATGAPQKPVVKQAASTPVGTTKKVSEAVAENPTVKKFNKGAHEVGQVFEHPLNTVGAGIQALTKALTLSESDKDKIRKENKRKK